MSMCGMSVEIGVCGVVWLSWAVAMLAVRVGCKCLLLGEDGEGLV